MSFFVLKVWFGVICELSDIDCYDSFSSWIITIGVDTVSSFSEESVLNESYSESGFAVSSNFSISSSIYNSVGPLTLEKPRFNTFSSVERMGFDKKLFLLLLLEGFGLSSYISVVVSSKVTPFLVVKYLHSSVV